MQLETERLILRPFVPEDAEDLYAYARDPRVGPSAGWPPHRSIEESREIIRTVFSQGETFAVVLRETGRVIGSISFTGHHRREAKGPDDELGYSLSPDYWGRGLIPEAARAMLAYGFEEKGLGTIWCCHFDGNQKSKRVIRKLGFRYRFLRLLTVPELDTIRLNLCYSMTREEWRK